MRGQMQNIIWWIVGLIALGVIIAAFLLPIGDILGGFFELPIFAAQANSQNAAEGTNSGESQGSGTTLGNSEQIICTNTGRYCNNIESGRHWDSGCYECIPLEGSTECRFTTANLPTTREACLR